MKERPIIFNAEMVRAILDGRKTQTRRLVPAWQLPKHYPDNTENPRYNWMATAQRHRRWGYGVFGETEVACAKELSEMAPCPFGSAGNRLWVRETFGDCGSRLVYRADSNDGASCKVKRWVPSIHMPRDACRLTLEITSVRVERLNDISNDDAKAEGYPAEREADGASCDPWLWFRDLWDGVYPEQTFKDNPWVWVIEFKRAGAPDGK